jgi:hypothetical protein
MSTVLAYVELLEVQWALSSHTTIVQISANLKTSGFPARPCRILRLTKTHYTTLTKISRIHTIFHNILFNIPCHVYPKCSVLTLMMLPKIFSQVALMLFRCMSLYLHKTRYRWKKSAYVHLKSTVKLCVNTKHLMSVFCPALGDY